jgi:hypothetical protein
MSREKFGISREKFGINPVDVWDLQTYLDILDTANVVTRIENKKDELWGNGAGLPSSSRVLSRPAEASDSGPVSRPREREAQAGGGGKEGGRSASPLGRARDVLGVASRYAGPKTAWMVHMRLSRVNCRRVGAWGDDGMLGGFLQFFGRVFIFYGRVLDFCSHSFLYFFCIDVMNT